MSDLISRQAAIEVLRNRWLKTRNYEGIGEDIAEECEIYLKTLPSAQPYTDEEIQKMQDIEQAQLDKIRELAYQDGKADAMKWISCSERLPEHGGRYLISVLDGINRRTTVAPYLPRCKAWAMNGRMAYWKVIAWMPLPEPAKLGGD